MRDLRCEGCGDRFRCRADDEQACWCASVTVPDEARVALAGTASDCVCPACLTEATLVATTVASSVDSDR
jgi:hypothetical protein